MGFIQELFITLYMIYFNSNKQYKWSKKFHQNFSTLFITSKIPKLLLLTENNLKYELYAI